MFSYQGVNCSFLSQNFNHPIENICVRPTKRRCPNMLFRDCVADVVCRCTCKCNAFDPYESEYMAQFTEKQTPPCVMYSPAKICRGILDFPSKKRSALNCACCNCCTKHQQVNTSEILVHQRPHKSPEKSVKIDEPIATSIGVPSAICIPSGPNEAASTASLSFYGSSSINPYLDVMSGPSHSSNVTSSYKPIADANISHRFDDIWKKIDGVDHKLAGSSISQQTDKQKSNHEDFWAKVDTVPKSLKISDTNQKDAKKKSHECASVRSAKKEVAKDSVLRDPNSVCHGCKTLAGWKPPHVLKNEKKRKVYTAPPPGAKSAALRTVPTSLAKRGVLTQKAGEEKIPNILSPPRTNSSGANTRKGPITRQCTDFSDVVLQRRQAGSSHRLKDDERPIPNFAQIEAEEKFHQMHSEESAKDRKDDDKGKTSPKANLQQNEDSHKIEEWHEEVEIHKTGELHDEVEIHKKEEMLMKAGLQKKDRLQRENEKRDNPRASHHRKKEDQFKTIESAPKMKEEASKIKEDGPKKKEVVHKNKEEITKRIEDTKKKEYAPKMKEDGPKNKEEAPKKKDDSPKKEVSLEKNRSTSGQDAQESRNILKGASFISSDILGEDLEKQKSLSELQMQQEWQDEFPRKLLQQLQKLQQQQAQVQSTPCFGSTASSIDSRTYVPSCTSAEADRSHSCQNTSNWEAHPEMAKVKISERIFEVCLKCRTIPCTCPRFAKRNLDCLCKQRPCVCRKRSRVLLGREQTMPCCVCGSFPCCCLETIGTSRSAFDRYNLLLRAGAGKSLSSYDMPAGSKSAPEYGRKSRKAKQKFFPFQNEFENQPRYNNPCEFCKRIFCNCDQEHTRACSECMRWTCFCEKPEECMKCGSKYRCSQTRRRKNVDPSSSDAVHTRSSSKKRRTVCSFCRQPSCQCEKMDHHPTSSRKKNGILKNQRKDSDDLVDKKYCPFCLNAVCDCIQNDFETSNRHRRTEKRDSGGSHINYLKMNHAGCQFCLQTPCVCEKNTFEQFVRAASKESPKDKAEKSRSTDVQDRIQKSDTDRSRSPIKIRTVCSICRTLPCECIKSFSASSFGSVQMKNSASSEEFVSADEKELICDDCWKKSSRDFKENFVNSSQIIQEKKKDVSKPRIESETRKNKVVNKKKTVAAKNIHSDKLMIKDKRVCSVCMITCCECKKDTFEPFPEVKNEELNNRRSSNDLSISEARSPSKNNAVCKVCQKYSCECSERGILEQSTDEFENSRSFDRRASLSKLSKNRIICSNCQKHPCVCAKKGVFQKCSSELKNIKIENRISSDSSDSNKITVLPRCFKKVIKTRRRDSSLNNSPKYTEICPICQKVFCECKKGIFKQPVPEFKDSIIKTRRSNDTRHLSLAKTKQAYPVCQKLSCECSKKGIYKQSYSKNDTVKVRKSTSNIDSNKKNPDTPKHAKKIENKIVEERPTMEYENSSVTSRTSRKIKDVCSVCMKKYCECRRRADEISSSTLRKKTFEKRRSNSEQTRRNDFEGLVNQNPANLKIKYVPLDCGKLKSVTEKRRSFDDQKQPRKNEFDPTIGKSLNDPAQSKKNDFDYVPLDHAKLRFQIERRSDEGKKSAYEPSTRADSSKLIIRTDKRGPLDDPGQYKKNNLEPPIHLDTSKLIIKTHSYIDDGTYRYRKDSVVYITQDSTIMKSVKSNPFITPDSPKAKIVKRRSVEDPVQFQKKNAFDSKENKQKRGSSPDSDRYKKTSFETSDPPSCSRCGQLICRCKRLDDHEKCDICRRYPCQCEAKEPKTSCSTCRHLICSCSRISKENQCKMCGQKLCTCTNLTGSLGQVPPASEILEEILSFTTSSKMSRTFLGHSSDSEEYSSEQSSTSRQTSASCLSLCPKCARSTCECNFSFINQVQNPCSICRLPNCMCPRSTLIQKIACSVCKYLPCRCVDKRAHDGKIKEGGTIRERGKSVSKKPTPSNSEPHEVWVQRSRLLWDISASVEKEIRTVNFDTESEHYAPGITKSTVYKLKGNDMSTSCHNMDVRAALSHTEEKIDSEMKESLDKYKYWRRQRSTSSSR